MPAAQPVEISITWEQAAVFRLGRHHLRERAPLAALAKVAGEMAGAQAQLFSAAQLSLWARVRDLRAEDIDAALRERALVKAACMRRTLFLVPAEELAVFTRGSARRAEKELRWTRGKGVPDRVIDAAIAAALGALDEPRTRPEIAERASRALGVQRQDVHGGGWGSRRSVAAVPVGDLTFPVVDLLHLASARGVICYGPNRGNEPTFVRADAWIPAWRDIPAEEAEERLLRKYLQAYCPATAADFALWSGMTLTEARAIWARAQADLAAVNVAGWTAEALREDLDALARASLQGPVLRLLPYFDTFLLGHKGREHLAAAEHRAKIYRAQGWIAPVALVDGRAAGVWEYAREGDRLRVNVEGFGVMREEVMEKIGEEARDLGRFLGAGVVEVILSQG